MQAMIKATEGADIVDPNFAGNIAAAAAAGIRTIPYHFVNADDIAAQAENFLETAQIGAGLPYAIDWEGQGTLDAEDLEDLGNRIASVVGRLPLGYWGMPGSAPGTPSAGMASWPWWLARYRFGAVTALPAGTEVASARVQAPFLFWQYTSSGTVPGIVGNVDRSVALFDTVADLVAWCDPVVVS